VIKKAFHSNIIVLGKETVNATLPVGLVMCRAIRDFYLKTGFKVAFLILIEPV
jgi:hypothetical protein